MKKYIIGLTGSIATGKSTLLHKLAEAGYAVFDADQINHDILEQDDELWAKLVTQFGDSILDPEGQICRSCLARVVFSDLQELQHLEELTHPRILARLAEQIQAAGKLKDNLVIVEATVLMRSPLLSVVDEIWIMRADRQQQIERLADRHFNEEEAEARIRAIGPIESHESIPSFDIDNSGTFSYTWQRAQELLNRAVAPYQAERF